MLRHVPLWLLLATLGAANMQYTFSPNGTCPGGGRPWDCNPAQESICGLETSQNKAYCCPVGYDYCSTGSTTCNGDDGLAGDDQIDCNAYGVKWCCSLDYEQCTQRINQTNVCLYDVDNNPYVDFDTMLAPQAWTSVLSASPTATFDGDQISSIMDAFSSSAMAATATPTPTASVTNSPEATGSSQPQPSATGSSGGISGGAIGGIVVGAVAAVLIVGAGAFFLLRRRRGLEGATQQGKYQPAPPSADEQGAVWSAERKDAYDDVSGPHELDTVEPRHEMATGQERPHELPSP